MSSHVISKMLETFPFSFLAYSFVSGLLLLFLSPLRYIFPSWVVDPFSLEPYEIFGSFLTIIVYSLCLGVLMYFAFPLLAGNTGLNQWISRQVRTRFRICEKKSIVQEKPIPLGGIHSIEFLKWLRENEFTFYSDFLLTQHMLIGGLICGSEAAFFINFFVGICICSFERVHPFHVSCVDLVSLSAVSFVVFVLSVAYNRKVFRDHFTNTWNTLKAEFLRAQK